MKHLEHIFKSILLSLTLTTLCWGQSSNLQGQLNIYSRPTQIGIIANRTFRDSKGRVSKIIFYGSKDNTAQAPYTENMLKEQSIVLYAYNDLGQMIRSEHYDAGMRLSFTVENSYYGDKERREVKYTPARVKQSEVRYINNSSVSQLYYDQSGKNLVSIRGLIPKDADLPFGWGEPIGGLACGIVLTRANSLIDETNGYVLYINLRNTGTSQIRISDVPHVEIELRNGAGDVVGERSDDPGNERHRLQSQRLFYGQLINPGESGYIYPAYELKLSYGDLPDGRYSIRARVIMGDNDQTLVSNAIPFEVDGRR